MHSNCADFNDLNVLVEEIDVYGDESVDCVENASSQQQSQTNSIPENHQVLQEVQNISSQHSNSIIASTSTSDTDWKPSSQEETSISENESDQNVSSSSDQESGNPTETTATLPKQKPECWIRRRKSEPHTRHRTADPGSWMRNQNIDNRRCGSSYLGIKCKLNDDGSYEWDYKVARPDRTLKERCKCSSRSVNYCHFIKDPERQEIFDRFWELSWDEKKFFVCQNIDTFLVKRPRSKVHFQSRRLNTFRYHFAISGVRHPVCQLFFLNTLNIGKWSVHNWKLNQDNDGISPVLQRNVFSRPQPERCEQRRQYLLNFFNSLAQVESHYCRKDTKRRYLEPLWRSKAELYRSYTEKCVEDKVEPLSNCIFSSTFADLNLSIFQRKKDECETCSSYRMNNINEIVYLEHLAMKNEARNAKATDKDDKSCITVTVDLQSILLAPHNNSSTMYYRTKLKVHNFTVYNLETKAGYCYVWHESNGDLQASVFCSLYVNFINNEIIPALKSSNRRRLVIYSDGCAYQNRNVQLSNALFNCALENNIVIEHKYLQVGHTQMEVDSMHAVIENTLRGRSINVPADFIPLMQIARRSDPYKVQYLDYKFFKNFSSIQNLKSIRPGRETVNCIRALRYNSISGELEYKIRHPDNYQNLSSRLAKTKFSFVPFCDLPPLFSHPLPITKEKFKHLQELKPVIPADFHYFYDNLPIKK